MKSRQLYIDGAWRDSSSGDTIAVIDPSSGRDIGRIAMADTSDMDDDLAAAGRGFRVWRATPVAEGGRLLRAVGGLMHDRVEVIAQDLTTKQGKALAQAMGEIFGAGAYFDDLRMCGMHIFERVVRRDGAGIDRTVLHESIGPVFAVSPWNLPMIPRRKIANNLAAGCSIIVEPAKKTTITACHLAQCCHDARILVGGVNILCGSSDSMLHRIIPLPADRNHCSRWQSYPFFARGRAEQRDQGAGADDPRFRRRLSRLDALPGGDGDQAQPLRHRPAGPWWIAVASATGHLPPW